MRVRLFLLLDEYISRTLNFPRMRQAIAQIERS